jgi:CRISPR-associated protein Csc1
VIVARSPQGWSRKDGQHWFQVEADGREKRQNATNRPQTGRIRLLAAENRATCYVFSRDRLTIPRYIRLGKFMSKARLNVAEAEFEVVQNSRERIACLLNPADLPASAQLTVFDMVNIPPMPLIRNALIEGAFYKLNERRSGRQSFLPYGMQFNVGAE